MDPRTVSSHHVHIEDLKDGVKHYLNRHKNQNADVERFHGLVEEYFYKQTKPVSKPLFHQFTESMVHNHCGALELKNLKFFFLHYDN